MLSTPLPKLAISFSFSPAWLEELRRSRSVTVGTSTSALGGLDELRLGDRPVIEVEAGIEQLAHARFDARAAGA